MSLPSMFQHCSAAFSAPDCSVANSGNKRPGRGRPGVDVQASKGGSPTLAILVGSAQGGRWQAELMGQSKASKAASNAVNLAAGLGAIPASSASSVNAYQDVLVGLVVFGGWQAVRGLAGHADTCMIMQASTDHHRKRLGQRFLEHKVLVAGMLCQRGQLGQLGQEQYWLPQHNQSFQAAETAGRNSLSELLCGNAHLVVAAGGRVGELVSISELLRYWELTWRIKREDVTAWQMWKPLAFAPAKGTWFGDVSVRHRRALPGEQTLAPACPSDRVWRHLLAESISETAPLRAAASSASPSLARERCGYIQRFDPGHMLRTVATNIRYIIKPR